MQCLDRGMGRTDRAFIQRDGRVYPSGEPVGHMSLIPIIMHGFEGRVLKRPDCWFELPEFSFLPQKLDKELEQRCKVLFAFNKCKEETAELVRGYVDGRLKSQLWRILSCGSLWAIGLGLVRASCICSSDCPDALIALLGLNEGGQMMGMKRQRACSARSICICSRYCVPGMDVTEPRRLIDQWAICYWLWEEIKVKKNRNVREFLKRCLTRSEREHGLNEQLVRVLVETKVVRKAVSDGTIDILELLRLYKVSGLGHCKEILQPDGLRLLRKQSVTLESLMRIPKHALVKALCKYSDFLSFSDIVDMVAPPYQRYGMITLLMNKRKQWEGDLTIQQLLSLPSLDSLEFVLSRSGKNGLCKKVYTLETFGLVRFKKKNARVLKMLIESDVAKQLLHDGVITVPKVVQNVQNIQVLSVLLSPAGAESLSTGRIQLQDFGGIKTAENALVMIRGKRAKRVQIETVEPCLGFSSNSGDTNRWGSPTSADECPSHGDDDLCALDREYLKRSPTSLFVSDSRRQKIREFIRRSKNESENPGEEEAEAFLKNSSWDVDQALDEFIAEQLHRKEAVISFRRLVNMDCSREQAVFYLKSASWNVTKAFAIYEQETRHSRERVSRERAFKRKFAGVYGIPSNSPKAIEEPTSSQLDTLMKFFSITGEQKEDTAVAMLRMCEWKLDVAVETYLAASGQT